MKDKQSKTDKAIEQIKKLNLKKVLQDDAKARIEAQKRRRREMYGF